MGLETGDFIDDLVITNPLGPSDPKAQGDDHIRLVKKVLKATFSGVDGAVPLTAAQFNDLPQAAAAETIAGIWDFTNAFKIGTVNILTGAIPISGAWVFSGTPDFTGDPTIDSIQIGFKSIPQNIQNGNYTCVLSDSGKQIYKASGGAGETITIPANASVAYPLGTALTFVNFGGGTLSIAITTDSMFLGGVGTSGTRTLADTSIATAVKFSAASWVITGAGLT